MTRLFSILPGWLWALIVAGLLASQIITSARLSAERLAHQTSKTEYAERVASAERDRAELETARRQTETELVNAQEAHAAEVAALSAQRDAARTSGRVVAGRVRDAARATAVLAGQVCADSTSTAVRETAATAAGMLAELRERADERAGILAEFATDAHLAGRACEREYDTAREKLKGAP